MLQAKPPAADAGRTRRPGPERTRQDILAVAREEFAQHGLAGARVDAIAARTRTTKRMIYYYFGSKEGLFVAVLEQAYASIRAVEQTLALESLAPEEAIRRLVHFTFDYHEANPDFSRLVSIENIHDAKYLAGSEVIRGLNATVLQVLAEILDRGARDGVFRPRLTPFDVHLMITSFCYFRVSNRHTFGVLFGQDLAAPDMRERHKRMISDAVVGLLRTDGAAAGSNRAV